MKKVLLRSTITVLTVLLFGKTYAQELDSSNFYDQIKNYDFSTILTTDSFLAEDREGSKDKIKRTEILGFIGDDYQRFYIHFVSIIQNPTNPYEYFVFGKTKVKENICALQGTIIIKEARIRQSSDIPDYEQGYVTYEVLLFEDKNQSATGTIKGTLKSKFIIDNKRQFRYDGVMFLADGFSNNQFTGSWTSYKANVSKKCNWGDYRIPESGELDIGAGEFSVNGKYFDKGWKYYILTQFGETEIDVEIGEKNEKIKWWR